MDFEDIIGKDEKVLELVQRHWVNVAPTILAFLVLCVVSLAGFYSLARYGSGAGSFNTAIIALVALLALGLLLGYASFDVYRQNRLIITDKNLYLITQNSLFNRKIAQFSLERLQDVSAAQNGVLASLLGYGDVTVETASAEENFVFQQAPHPRSLAARIMECHKQSITGTATPVPD